MKRLAMYLRLSLEDKKDFESGLADESNSIVNQRKQIYEYIHLDLELCGYETVEFCDDGYSGTNMDRPDMCRLLNEVRKHNIDCIIVKDMSRFSRDYIELGTYLNKILPFMGVRFIAINDNYDSRKHKGSTIELDTAFKTLLYDLYSKDISLKVKAAFNSKCESGEYIFGQAPFGYEKSSRIKNALMVNEKEARIVRYIFSLALQGKSSVQIARQLYEEKVPTVTQLRSPDRKYNDGRIHSWSENVVTNILNNRFYLGEMAYAKTLRKAVGSRVRVSLPKDEWKIIPNHHKALISEQVFEQVSLLRRKNMIERKSSANNGDKSPLTGKIFCGGCGYSMKYRPVRGKNRYRHFECTKHALLKIPECCTYINTDYLEKTVLTVLNTELMIRGDAAGQREKVMSFQNEQIRKFKKILSGYRREKKKLMAKQESLYEQCALKSFCEFKEAKDEYEKAQEEYEKGTDELCKALSDISQKEYEVSLRLDKLSQEYKKIQEESSEFTGYLYLEELTQQTVDTFIKKICTYKDKRIEIEFNWHNQ